MITIRRSEDRGHANHGWLDSYHTFSFADYFDPDYQGFGHLRVINQDRVEPGKGFQTHGHRDMEIVSYVLDGTLEHKDSMGHGSQMRPGDVQLMSAGTGVTHSEFNASGTDPLHFLQMWIIPRERGTTPRYEQRNFPEAERTGQLRLVVSPDGEADSVRIGQDARLFAGLLEPDQQVAHSVPNDRAGWLQVARGRLSINGQPLGPGDGAAIHDESKLTITGLESTEFVMWEIPAASVRS